MRISEFKTSPVGDRTRISAQLSWENSDSKVSNLYFETPTDHSEILSLDTSPFLVGASVAALYFGEQRLLIEGPVCGELLSNIDGAIALLKHWYYPPERQFSIEADAIASYKTDNNEKHSGLFFSGGVDSFFTLQQNRNLIPEDHPLYMRKAVLAFGLELDEELAFDTVVNAIRPIAESCGLDFLPIYTNVYLPYRRADKAQGFSMWLEQMNGPALASVAHACSGVISDMSISSTLQPADIGHHYGSHPLIDEALSSARVRLRHQGIAYTRLQKLRSISGSNIALNSLRVCNQFQLYKNGQLNCEKCEKCIRTKLGLIAIGALEQSGAFQQKDVLIDDIHERLRLKAFQIPMYEELLKPLQRTGRNDLVKAIKIAITKSISTQNIKSSSIRHLLKKGKRRILRQFFK